MANDQFISPKYELVYGALRFLAFQLDSLPAVKIPKHLSKQKRNVQGPNDVKYGPAAGKIWRTSK